MKTWAKGYELNKEVESFTVRDDYILDKELVEYDCQASLAHARMLKSIKLLSKEELSQLVEGLNEIIKLNRQSRFKIRPEDEDCHTAIENFLTTKYGDVGKKIHTARSRNDQVLTALRLYEKTELGRINKSLDSFTNSLKKLIKKHGTVTIPGYTHMQRAMPTDIATWLGCFVASVQDNKILLSSILKIIDQSPLGTAAGFGVPVLEIKRKMTAGLLNFGRVMENPIYAQLSRGKFEASIVHLCSQIVFDLNKLANDLILFNMSEFGFVYLPDDFCTGSSIMPQKKNPDILELVRANYHVLLGEQLKISGIIGNLISGYNRDVQLTKAPLINSFKITRDCLRIFSILLDNLRINRAKCHLSPELSATEEVYKLVKKGVPFRDAYREIAHKYHQSQKKR